MVVAAELDDVKIDQIDEQPTQAQVAILMTEGKFPTLRIISYTICSKCMSF